MKEVVITCDARCTSTLDWSQLRTQALNSIAAGKKILWFLDFGLFSEVKKTLKDPGQFLSFCLAIDHFKEKIWAEFHKFSLGVALYRGDSNFLPQFIWDDTQKQNFEEWQFDRKINKNDPFAELLFARDVSVEYLIQLSHQLLGEITPYVIFDKMPQDILLKVLLTAKDRYERIQHYFTCEGFHWKTQEEMPIGVCVPSFSMVNSEYLIPFRKFLEAFPGDYKLIPEDELIESWQGLNLLYVFPKAVSPGGKRKIQGFLAAGGEVETLGTAS